MAITANNSDPCCCLVNWTNQNNSVHC